MWTKVDSNNEHKWVDIKPVASLSESHKSWIKVAASNKFASEEDLLSIFIEQGFPEQETKKWISFYAQSFDSYY